MVAYTTCLKGSIKSLWRNRLARSAVNRKVGGSSPPRDGLFLSTTILGGDGHVVTTTIPNLINKSFSTRIPFPFGNVARQGIKRSPVQEYSGDLLYW